MTGGRTLGLLALATMMSLAGCERWCERNYPAASGNCCAPAAQPCCAPVSNYPVQAQPCAPATGGWTGHP